MFGKTLRKNDDFVVNNTIDDSCVLYQATIVDDFLLEETVDGSVFLQSDIRLLKNLNVSSSDALAEALSLRFSKRSSSSFGDKTTDAEKLKVLKSRYFQDPTEIAAYREALREQLGRELSDEEYNDLISQVSSGDVGEKKDIDSNSSGNQSVEN